MARVRTVLPPEAITLFEVHVDSSSARSNDSAFFYFYFFSRSLDWSDSHKEVWLRVCLRLSNSAAILFDPTTELFEEVLLSNVNAPMISSTGCKGHPELELIS